MARDKKTLNHSIEFTPSALTLSKSGDSFTGKTTVKLTNINSGYTLDTTQLPSGVTVAGYTGTKGEQLTITAPSSAAGKTFTLSATGERHQISGQYHGVYSVKLLSAEDLPVCNHCTGCGNHDRATTFF